MLSPSYVAEVTALRQRVDELEAELAILKTTLEGDGHTYRAVFHLSMMECRLLTLLMSGRTYRLQHIADACGMSTENCVTVMACRLRKALPWLRIVSRGGRGEFGYTLPPEMIAEVKARAASGRG